MNNLRAAFVSALATDATLIGYMGGGRDRVLTAWPATEMPLSPSLPVYLIVQFSTGARRIANRNAANDVNVQIHVFAITERKIHATFDRISTLAHLARWNTSTIKAASTFEASRTVVPEPRKGCHHGVIRYEIRNAFVN